MDIKMLKNIVDSASQILGLNDPTVENQQMISDRTAVGGDLTLTTVDQAAVSVAQVGHHLDDEFPASVDLSQPLLTRGEKFYVLKQWPWSANDVVFKKIIDIDPYNELTSHSVNRFAVRGITNYYRYMRADLDVIVQINPTQTQLGCLAVFLVPGDADSISFANIGVLPHGYLNCNINNSVRLRAPFVYTRGLYDIRRPISRVWSILVVVYSKLKVGTSGPSECPIVVLGRFVNLEVHGMMPTDDLQATMNEFRITSGTNVANLCDGSELRFAMPMTLGTGDDFEEDLSNSGGLKVTHFRTWTETPSLMTSFPVNASHTAGSKVATWVVTPCLYTMRDEDGVGHPTGLASVAQNYNYWRGDLVYHLQVVSTRFHSCRLLIAFFPGDEGTNVGNYNMFQASNGLCAIMDCQGVFSTCVFRVPWVSDTRYRLTKISKRENVAAGKCAIGRVTVYAYNKLTFPNNVSQHIIVNVYVSARNLELFCPLWDNIVRSEITNAGSPYTAAGDEPETNEGFSTAPVVQQEHLGKPVVVSSKAQELRQGAVTAIEDPGLEQKAPQTFPQKDPGTARHKVDHMDMYAFSSRGHLLTTFTFNKPGSGAKKTFSFSLELRRRRTSQQLGMGGVLQWFFSTFHLYRGPLVITLVFQGDTNIDGIVWFTPNEQKVPALWDQVDGSRLDLTPDYITSQGAVRFNSRDTSVLSLKVPFYCMQYAISSSVHPTCPDTSLGTISVFIGNYSSTDERFGLTVYLAVPPDALMLVPRPVLRYNAILPSLSGGLAYMEEEPHPEMTLMETSVDYVPDTRVKPGRKVLPATEFPLELRMYRELRMEVGEHRMRYAKEELQKEGDEVQTQAGNIFDDYVLVQRRQNNVLFRGFHLRGDIYFANCCHPGVCAVPLLKTGVFEKVGADSSWLSLNSKVDINLAESWVRGFVEGRKFNWAQFTRGEYKSSMDASMWTQLDSVCDARFGELCAIFAARSLGVLDRVLIDSNLYQDINGVTADVRVVATECKSLMDGISGAVQGLAKTLSRKKPFVVVRVVTILAKFSIRIYIGAVTKWSANVLLPLLSEMALDAVELSVDVGGLVRGLMSDLFQTLAERSEEDQIETQSLNWLRDLNNAISAFKSAKQCFSWVVDRYNVWYKEKFGENKARMEFLLENEELIEGLIGYADTFCTRQVVKEEDVKDGTNLLKELRTLYGVINSDPELRQQGRVVLDTIKAVQIKLRDAPPVFHEDFYRPEPVVVFLYGLRGSGKSIASLALATMLCKKLGVDPKKNIYTKGPLSEYWDGYEGQAVCIIDDIGQGTDDKDWVGFCQLVSSCPLVLNMASLEQKGTEFKSPFIICTSNLNDPEPRTVYFPEAITRRLHWKVGVRARDYYTQTQNGVATLNVEKARRDGVLKNLECIEMKIDGSPITIEALVDAVFQSAKQRRELVDEMIDLWSQSNGCDSFALLVGNHAKAKASPKMVGFFRFLRDHKLLLLGGIGSILAASGLIYAGWKMGRSQLSTGAYEPVMRPNRVVRLGENVMTQSVLDVTTLVHKNLCKFGVSADGNAVSWRLNALGLFDTMAAVPAHAFRYDENVKYFFLSRNGTVYATSKDRLTILEMEGNQDLVFIDFPGIPKFKDIREHFVSRSDIETCNDKVATLATYNCGIFQLINEGPVSFRDGMTYYHLDDAGKKHSLWVPEVWQGTGEAEKGSCGGALVSGCAKLNNPILGVHVAAGGGVLVSVCVTKECLMSLKCVLSNSTRIKQVVKAERTLYTSGKTQYVPSEIQTVFPAEVSKEPAPPIYNPGADIDTLSAMMAKYNAPLVAEPEGFDVAAGAVMETLVSNFDFRPGRQLSEQQAIEGIEGLDGIDMQTSPGIPYVFHNLDKKRLISNGKIVHPLLLARTNQHFSDMLIGSPCNVVFQTCAKDELRPKEKVRLGLARSIEAAPVDFVIAMRMLLGHAVAIMQSHPSWTMGMAVGINPDTDWTPMIREALRFGDYAVCLDFRNFDASVQPFMLRWVFEVFRETSGISKEMARSMFLTIAYNKRQVSNLVYYVEGSNPSGVPFTSVINSLINLMCLRYVFAKLLDVSPFKVLEFVKFLTYGDDVFAVVARGLDLSELHLELVPRLFSQLGMQVTGADKGVVKTESVMKSVFLKRIPRADLRGLVHPCLSWESIYSLVQWRRKGTPLQENLLNACRFAYHYGEEEYNEFVYKLQHACEMVGLTIRRQVQVYHMFSTTWTRSV
nr:polyprotein [Mute swan feces associated hepatovirus 3]